MPKRAQILNTQKSRFEEISCLKSLMTADNCKYISPFNVFGTYCPITTILGKQTQRFGVFFVCLQLFHDNSQFGEATKLFIFDSLAYFVCSDIGTVI